MKEMDNTTKVKIEYEIKPCPFCGSNAALQVFIPNTQVINLYVQCSNGKCQTHGKIGSVSYGDFTDKFFESFRETVQRVTNSWNSRADQEQAEGK